MEVTACGRSCDFVSVSAVVVVVVAAAAAAVRFLFLFFFFFFLFLLFLLLLLLLLLLLFLEHCRFAFLARVAGSIVHIFTSSTCHSSTKRDVP